MCFFTSIFTWTILGPNYWNWIKNYSCASPRLTSSIWSGVSNVREIKTFEKTSFRRGGKNRIRLEELLEWAIKVPWSSEEFLCIRNWASLLWYLVLLVDFSKCEWCDINPFGGNMATELILSQLIFPGEKTSSEKLDQIAFTTVKRKPRGWKTNGKTFEKLHITQSNGTNTTKQ